MIHFHLAPPLTKSQTSTVSSKFYRSYRPQGSLITATIKTQVKKSLRSSSRQWQSIRLLYSQPYVNLSLDIASVEHVLYTNFAREFYFHFIDRNLEKDFGKGVQDIRTGGKQGISPTKNRHSLSKL